MNDVAVIAIGRNEGDRLRRCLASVCGRGMPVVYVDSASTDGSVAAARSLGAEVVELDMSKPFSAARARNAGFDRLTQVAPGTRFVQFVDGDCEVVEGWVERARRELDARDDVAVVCGRRRERFPEASVYNRLADVEWDTPIGEAQSCGGDSLMRVGSFKEVCGFDATVVAGEEPELCQRLRAKGWKIVRVDAEMTLHDSAMLHFGQWWKRAVRGGYGAADVATRFGHERFAAQVQNARHWAITWPAVLACFVVAPAISYWFQWGFRGEPVTVLQWTVWAALVAGVACLPLFLMLRLALRVRRRVPDWKSAMAYGALGFVGKFANVTGQRQYARDRREGRHARLIEYKAAAAAAP